MYWVNKYLFYLTISRVLFNQFIDLFRPQTQIPCTQLSSLNSKISRFDACYTQVTKYLLFRLFIVSIKSHTTSHIERSRTLVSILGQNIPDPFLSTCYTQATKNTFVFVLLNLCQISHNILYSVK